MTYATVSDMVTQLGEAEVLSLSDRTSSGVVDDALVADALARASSEIDSYLATRHQVPLTVVPPMLKTRCVEIAYYLLCRGARVINDDIVELYKDAIRWLRDVAAGKASLGLPKADAETVQDDVVLFVPAVPSIFQDSVVADE